MDIRTQTTKSNLKKALLQCMKKQAFSEIKVKDIILAEFNKALLADRSAVNGNWSRFISRWINNSSGKYF